MGFSEFLTLVFVTLKLLNVIDWPWRLVLLPEIIAAVLYVAAFMFGLGIIGSRRKW